MISWTDPTPSLLISRDGRIALDEYYSSSVLGGYAIGVAVESSEQREFYLDHLFKILYWYLRRSPRDAWRQPTIVRCRPNGVERPVEEADELAKRVWQTVDHKRASLVRKPKCARLNALKEWMRSQPAWASMAMGASLAAAGGLSLLTGDAIRDLSIRSLYNAVEEAQYEADVAERCYSLSELSDAEITLPDDNAVSFSDLVMRYGPAWLMQALYSLSPDPEWPMDDLDLTRDADGRWSTGVDDAVVIEACRLAGALNAPIEMWPRFYRILRNAGPLRLDEITVLAMLSTPITWWRRIKNGSDEAGDGNDLAREACLLIAAERRRFRREDKGKDIQREVLASLSPTSPMASQMTDLAIALDDALGSRANETESGSTMRLIKEKPDMDGTINGMSLLVRDLDRRNRD